MALNIGLLLFPKLTQLDLTGPLQVFSRIPNVAVHLVAKTMAPVASDTVLMLPPTIRFADCPQLDVICVPGGAGTDDLVTDDDTLSFLRRQAQAARYLTSVCTGSLVLGAAGLLCGYRAATHWTAIDHLAAFGAIPDRSRVCIDRNRITGGGVTAGIDFALALAALLTDQITAQAIQLSIEYDPAPPFTAGSPQTAPQEIVALVKQRTAQSRQRRAIEIAEAAARLDQNLAAPT